MAPLERVSGRNVCYALPVLSLVAYLFSGLSGGFGEGYQPHEALFIGKLSSGSIFRICARCPFVLWASDGPPPMGRASLVSEASGQFQPPAGFYASSEAVESLTG